MVGSTWPGSAYGYCLPVDLNRDGVWTIASARSRVIVAGFMWQVSFEVFRLSQDSSPYPGQNEPWIEATTSSQSYFTNNTVSSAGGFLQP